MISLTSRYADGELVLREDPRTGTMVSSVLRTWYDYDSDVFLYQWKMGDRPDIVMNRLGLPPESYHLFMDVNPGIVDPARIDPGTMVRVPNVR